MGTQDKKEMVCEAVLAMLLEGIPAASLKVSDIAERAGIGKGSVYMYFPSKEHVISEAISYLIDSMAETMKSYRIPYPDFEKSFKAFLREHPEHMQKYFNFADPEAPLKFLNIISDDLKESIKLKSVEMQHLYFKIINDLLDIGIARGIIKSGYGTFELVAIANMIVSTSAYFLKHADDAFAVSIDELIQRQYDFIVKQLS